MARIVVLGALALLSQFPAPPAAATIPSWLLLSTSDTDPWQQVTQSWVGDRTFHLWFLNFPATELQFRLEGSLEVVSFTPATGVQNVGSGLSLHILFDAGCAVPGPDLAMLLGTVVVRDAGGGGSVCFAQSGLSGRFCFHDCAPGGYWWELVPYDLHTAPGVCPVVPRAPDCNPISVDGTSWGRVKSTYR